MMIDNDAHRSFLRRFTAERTRVATTIAIARTGNDDSRTSNIAVYLQFVVCIDLVFVYVFDWFV
jgi:hypothetical protein